MNNLVARQRISRVYNTVHEVCRVAQDLSLFLGGIFLGSGDITTGVMMLAIKVTLGILDDEVSYRKAYAITKEAINDKD